MGAAQNVNKYGKTVTVLPKHLDKFGVKLTTLPEDQASYISVGVKGPFKGDAYSD